MGVKILHCGVYRSFDARMAEYFLERGTSADLVDIRTLNIFGLDPRRDAFVNRVYPSYTFEQDPSLANNFLDAFRFLDRNGFSVVNGYRAAMADLDKLHAYRKMERAGLPVPKTYVIKNETDAIEHARILGYPVIIKPRVGGRGLGVEKAETQEELEEILDRLHVRETPFLYLLQEFIEPIEPRDRRVCVTNSEVILSYARDIHTTESGQWKAGMSLEIPDNEMAARWNQNIYTPSQAEVEMVLRAAEVLDADSIEMDVYYGKLNGFPGFFCIDPNITPGYNPHKRSLIKKVLEATATRIGI